MSRIEESIRITLRFVDLVNKKDLLTLSELLSNNCVFEDLWEDSPISANKTEVVQYLSNQFMKFPKGKMVIVEANNLVHKCIAKYNYFGISNDDDDHLKCLGVFEVKSGMISSVSLYTKK
ncbi:hypothetical protein [Gracilinema caldarium]|nr:hypothetical protein [Gracilinema caldarium]